MSLESWMEQCFFRDFQKVKTGWVNVFEIFQQEGYSRFGIINKHHLPTVLTMEECFSIFSFVENPKHKVPTVDISYF